MKFMISSKYFLRDFEEGKLITNIDTQDSYYIENDLFEVLLPATTNFTDFDGLNYNDVYNEESIKKFVLSLVDSKIFISK
ncbi:hypothetical protein CN447_29150 [Bacillus thuringiensis]|uniref:hypothetical protein n=2 Tax=Bacillus TaxID=1386 RepID=UPI0002F32880|nr:MULTISPECIES: hypothetical protein [Bacillus cereus group]HDR8142805.1 hypothetical protein [Bacillus cereus]MED3622389.1 hypothetical protein [Bacillus thuringiensis]PEW80984.1 hypothetical protein CN447_29150 [Bacillus thuringiensis]PGS61417.1 hypothetical protein COD07_30930 [Bacillus thuringiensis]HDX9688683.1 hypothetical protein [Bacillus thuringiensis]